MEPTRAAFAAAGGTYQSDLAQFNAFVDALQQLPQYVPSLAFGARVPNQVEFTFLGQRQCLRHGFQFVKGQWRSTITRLFRATPDSKDYTVGLSLLLNQDGNLGVPNGAWPYSVQNDSERAFYFLMVGQ